MWPVAGPFDRRADRRERRDHLLGRQKDVARPQVHDGVALDPAPGSLACPAVGPWFTSEARRFTVEPWDSEAGFQVTGEAPEQGHREVMRV